MEECSLTAFRTDSATMRIHLAIASEHPRLRVEPTTSHNTATKAATGFLDPAKSPFDAHSAAQRFTPTHF